jgi:hypothetical protein
MKRKTALAAALCFVFAVGLAGWVYAGPPVPPTGSSSDKVYNVLDPRGIQAVVPLYALSPRLTGPLAGKKILFEQGEADPVVMPYLWARLQADPLFAGVIWYREVSDSFGPSAVETTADAYGAPFWTKTAGKLIDAVIRGNSW